MPRSLNIPLCPISALNSHQLWPARGEGDTPSSAGNPLRNHHRASFQTIMDLSAHGSPVGSQEPGRNYELEIVLSFHAGLQLSFQSQVSAVSMEESQYHVRNDAGQHMKVVVSSC